jgi:tight adherence protein B
LREEQVNMVIAIGTFIGVLALVYGTYWFAVQQPETAEHRALRKRMKVSGMARLGQTDLLANDAPLGAGGTLDRMLRNTGALVGPLQTQVDRADLKVSLGVVVVASVCIGGLAFAALLFTTRLWGAAILVGLALCALPYVVIKMMAARRLAKFEEQFPEAIDLMARALRAGHAFTTALGMAAEEVEDPAGREFRLVHDRQNFGMPLADALRDMARRVPLIDARFFVTAVLTQREAGGNLAEVLDNLSTLMRERFRVKRQVRAISAHGRITGWVLTFLAPTLAAILIVIAPSHMAVMVEDRLGIQMVVGALVLQVIGIIAVRRIIDIEV